MFSYNICAIYFGGLFLRAAFSQVGCIPWFGTVCFLVFSPMAIQLVYLRHDPCSEIASFLERDKKQLEGEVGMGSELANGDASMSGEVKNGSGMDLPQKHFLSFGMTLVSHPLVNELTAEASWHVVVQTVCIFAVLKFFQGGGAGELCGNWVCVGVQTLV